MVRKIISGIIVALLLASMLAVAYKIQPASADNVDWWPTFRHDPSHTGTSTSTGPTTSTLQWIYKTGLGVDSSPAVANGLLYVGSFDDNVYCLNSTNGTFVWSYATGSSWPSGVDSSPAIAGGMVYVGSENDNVYCLNAATGALVWRYTTGSFVDSCPAVVGGLVYVGSYDGRVYCLSAATGTQVWSYATGSAVASSPAVANGLVYVGSWDNSTYCLNAGTGAFVWSYKTGYWVESSPAVVGGLVYVGSDDGNVYCLNATTGAFVWSYTTGWSVDSSPAVVSGLVYVGSEDGNVYCLNAATGAKVWSYTTGWHVDSSPAVVSGLVYVGSFDDNVYCLNATTGAFVWSYKTGSGVDSSPAVVDGVVYVGSDDYNVYAFGSSSSPPAVSISPSSVTLFVGQSQLFTSLVTGGTPPYIYQWCLNGAAVQDATFSSWSFKPTSAGSYIVCLEVKDSVGGQATSNTANVTVTGPQVSSPPAPSFWMVPATVSFTTVNASVGTLFNVTVWGSCLDFTFTWQVQLGWNPSLLQEVNYGYSDGGTSELFAGYVTRTEKAAVDNSAGTLEEGECLVSQDYVNASSNSLFWVEFKVTAAPAPGQTLTCNIDPGYGAPPSIDNTYFLYTMAYASEAEETPLSTAPCAYTFAYTARSIPGDITGKDGLPDGRVDIRDIACVAASFGTASSNPNWNPNCDLNNDLRVDMKDIATVAAHFGDIDP